MEIELENGKKVKIRRMTEDNVLVEILDEARSSLLADPDPRKGRRGNLALRCRVLAVGPGYWGHVRQKPNRPDRNQARGRNPANSDNSPRTVGQFIATEVRPGQIAYLDGSLAGDEIAGDYRIVRESEIALVVE